MTKDHWKALGGFGIITLLLLLCGLAAAAPARAQTVPCVDIPATQEQGTPTIEVVDTEAWIEYIEHPAVTEERLVTPAVEEQAEKFYLKYEYVKQVRGVVQQRDNGRGTWHNVPGKSFDWTAWSSTQWSDKDVDVLESGPHGAVVREWTEGNGNKRWREFSTEYRYVQTGRTEKVVTQAYVPGKAAVYETVTITPARTETIEHAATYKMVDNPDYRPATDGYTCPPAQPEEEPSPTPTEPTPTTPTTPVDEPTTSPTTPSPSETPASASPQPSESPHPTSNEPSALSTQGPIQDVTRTELARTGTRPLPWTLGALAMIGGGAWLIRRTRNA